MTLVVCSGHHVGPLCFTLTGNPQELCSRSSAYFHSFWDLSEATALWELLLFLCLSVYSATCVHGLENERKRESSVHKHSWWLLTSNSHFPLSFEADQKRIKPIIWQNKYKKRWKHERTLELLNLFWCNQSLLGYSSDVDFSYDYYGAQKPPLPSELLQWRIKQGLFHLYDAQHRIWLKLSRACASPVSSGGILTWLTSKQWLTRGEWNFKLGSRVCSHMTFNNVSSLKFSLSIYKKWLIRKSQHLNKGKGSFRHVYTVELNISLYLLLSHI